MSPLTDEEQQYNGNDMANIQLSQGWVPVMQPFTSKEAPAEQNSNILSDVTEDKHYESAPVNT